MLEKISNTHFSFPKKFKYGFISKTVLYVVLITLAFIFLYPFIFMLVTSFKTTQDLNDITVVWIPNQLYFENYKQAISIMEYPIKLLRTVIIVFLCVFGHVISGAFIGYGFSRYQFKGKNILFFFLIMSMVIPIQTLIIPEYILFSKIGWINTVFPLIVPTYFGFGLQGALFVFIFRQFFLSLPKSLEEAAYIDGSGPVKTFFKVALPTTGSSVLVCTVLGMVWHWNDVFEPTIYLVKKGQYTLPMMLATVEEMVHSDIVQQQELSMVEYSDATIMAAAVLVVIPLLIVFAFLQKGFVQGIERSGITGE